MRRMLVSLVVLAALVIVACSPGGGATQPPAGAPSPVATPATDSPAGSGDPGSSATAAPARSPVPGYETWQTVNSQSARITLEDGALVMDLIGSGLWFNSERGVLFHTVVTGDFVATATVRTAKSSDPSAPPGLDTTIQLAGLMARAEVPVENYVFIVTGSLGSSTGLEAKTTTSSRSVWVQRGVGDAGDADLRLCRTGPTFLLSWRAPGSADPWQNLATFDRPDLPETLQVGANIYTDDVPDLVARFEGLTIAPPAEAGGCTPAEPGPS